MAGALILSKKEKKTKLKKIVCYSRRLLGLEDSGMNWIVEFTRKFLVCDDYISFCGLVVLVCVHIYIHIYILHYTDDNILRTNVVDT